METLYNNALRNMENTVKTLAERVPAPVRVPHKDSFVFRHIEKTIHQAIIQKLARLVSSLDAAKLLMNHGFVQEQAALQRILDELQEDITFLAYGVIYNDITPRHQKYLADFFEEEFDTNDALSSTQRRQMQPRDKIRAYIASIEGTGLDPSTHTKVTRTLNKAYSGFVHAASPHIMDMYFGNPSRFHVRGMPNTIRHEEYKEDIWSYFHRGIIAFAFAALAFSDQDLFNETHQFSKDFESKSGKSYINT